MNTRTTEAFKLYYENVIKKDHNYPEFIDRWGKDPSRLETQTLTHKLGVPIAGTKRYAHEGEECGPARWPYNSKDTPNYSDPPIQYMISKWVRAIGSSGWNWKEKKTEWIGLDIDSIIDHADGIDPAEMAKIRNIDLPWVELIRSTHGEGLHLYIRFKEPFPITENHCEHAAIAKSFIPILAKHTGIDLQGDVDAKGLILWMWHQDATKENKGFSLLKPATQLLTAEHVSPHWRDHLEVVTGGRSIVRVQGWTADGTLTEGDELDEMTQARSRIQLDDIHLRILDDLEGTGHSSMWVHDHHLWQGHTAGLKKVFDDWEEAGHPMKGLFATNSMDSDPGKPNCFMRPKPDGAWDVYRFGEGIGEHALWGTQGKWTHAPYNFPPTLRQICLSCGGFEGPDASQGYIFSDVDELKEAMTLLKVSAIVPDKAQDRILSLRDVGGKTVLTISKSRADSPKDFPRYAKTSKGWECLLDAIETSDAAIADDELWSDLDEQVRALKADSTDGQCFDSWLMKDVSKGWCKHPRENIKSFLMSLGHKQPDPILGSAIFKSWRIVNMPFQPEYPGDRKWNRGSAQFVYQPVDLAEGESPHHPHWDIIMNHCGHELNNYIPDLHWCNEWGITNGGDYLKAWVACMFQNPFGRLPYLFMYGAQNTGKTTFWEILKEMLTRGAQAADRALTSQQGYNGELEGVILAYIDEVDLGRAGSGAYNKLKDWTTGTVLNVHPKYKQVYSIRNTLHFVQVANTRKSLPVFPGDTRITAMKIPTLEKDIPRDELKLRLHDEAPHFMYTALNWDIPKATGRFMLPVIETQGKMEAAAGNMSELEVFIKDSCFSVNGSCVQLKEFKDRFVMSLEDFQRMEWSEKEIKSSLSEHYPIGKGKGNVHYIGNISFTPCDPTDEYTLKGERLTKKGEE